MKKLNLILETLFMISGLIALIIFFHELWHVLNHGIPVGVCVGLVHSTGGPALAGVAFNPPQPLDMSEEVSAWIFGVVTSGILFLTYLYTEFKK